VRVATLDEPDRLSPDIHMYPSSKQPWVTLPPGAKAVPAFYNPADVWSPPRAVANHAGESRKVNHRP
jgi:hypothetical protein